MYEYYTIVDLTYDDPTLYPARSHPRSPDPFAWEATDGRTRQALRVKEATVQTYTPRGWQPDEAMSRRPCEVIFTDARLIMFRKDHALLPGRLGKVLCAHIRYWWISQVSALPDRRGNWAAVRVVVDAGSVGDTRFVALVLPVTRNSDVYAFAAYLTRLVANCRLAAGVPSGEIPRWSELADDRNRPAAGIWNMPSYVQARTGGTCSTGTTGLAAGPAPREFPLFTGGIPVLDY